jgi:hypothetical protein
MYALQESPVYTGQQAASLQKVRCGLLQSLLFQRYLLPAQSSKPLRVCMTCYDELSSQGAEHSFNKEPRSGQDSSGEEDSDDEDVNGSIENNDKPSSFYSAGDE